MQLRLRVMLACVFRFRSWEISRGQGVPLSFLDTLPRASTVGSPQRLLRQGESGGAAQ